MLVFKPHVRLIVEPLLHFQGLAIAARANRGPSLGHLIASGAFERILRCSGGVHLLLEQGLLAGQDLRLDP